MTIAVSEINIYPLKSAAPIVLQQSKVSKRGLAFDRHWMLIDADGVALTAREFPGLLKVQSHPSEAGVVFEAPDNPKIELELPVASAEKTIVDIWSTNTSATLVSEQADMWFGEYLNTNCRLVCMRDEDTRKVEQKVGGTKGDVVSFADENPLLLITESSLEQLNERLEKPVTMLNFRPNIVVSGSVAFEEDNWTNVKIGDAKYRVAQACKRCNLTTIDPKLAQFRGDGEPLKTLAKFRYDRDKSGVLFGIHLIPENQSSTIKIGDVLTISS